MKYLLLSLMTLQLHAQEVTDSWIKAVPPGLKMSAAYMKITNSTSKDMYLTHVKTIIAEYPELHTHEEKNGIMKMRQVKKVLIKAKESTELKPKSFHVMLIQLTRKLKIGELIKLDLFFSNGAKRTVMAPVKKL